MLATSAVTLSSNGRMSFRTQQCRSARVGEMLDMALDQRALCALRSSGSASVVAEGG